MAENKEKIREYNRKYRQRHREKIRVRHKKWCQENEERNRAHKRKHYENNPDSYNKNDYWKKHPAGKAAHCAKRRAKKNKASPQWADFEKIDVLYQKAGELGFWVDHIVPLTSKKVCGLHCEDNLQLLHPSLNMSKGNRAWPDM